MSKLALLSMDVEDWYHLEYFGRNGFTEPSMLDGLERFQQLLAAEGQIPGTFFVVGEVARAHPALIRQLQAGGHEIASHGPDHRLASEISTPDFVSQLRADKEDTEGIVGVSIRGYRAPCFALGDEKLRRLPELGFQYDSSWIRFTRHPLYIPMDLSQWAEPCRGVRRAPDADFFEFEIPTARWWGGQVPFAGGAYFRVFPRVLVGRLVRRYLAQADVFVFYVHPFECSAQRLTAYPPETAWANKLRFQLGRASMLARISWLVRLLRGRGFEFVTFTAARGILLA